MKKIFSIFLAMSVLAGLSTSVTSCFQEQPEILESLELGACLSPRSISASIDINTGRDVTFTWTNSNGATNYVLEIFGSPSRVTDLETLFSTATPITCSVEPGEGSTTSHTIQLEEATYYYVRVKAQQLDDAGNPVIDDSNWTVLTNAVEPYLMMNKISSFTVTERTANSITVSWTIAEDDADGINAIRVTPHPTNPQEGYLSISVASDARTYTIPELTPSTKYTIAAHFGSADRSRLEAWTKPNLGSPTEVSTDVALLNALKSGASPILVKYKDTPYRISTGSGEAITDAEIGVTDNKDIAIYGEGTPSGEMPTIIGRFKLPDGLTSLHLEGLNLDGDSYAISHVILLADGFNSAASEISMLNCNVTSYQQGFFYTGQTPGEATPTLGELSFKNVYFSDIEGNGGNGFDIRTNLSIENLTVSECTFSQGFRTLFHARSGGIKNISITKCTLNNLCAVDNSNNQGLFDLRLSNIETFVISDNLILNINGHETRSRFFSGNSGVTKGPTTFSNNWFYNLGAGFWKNGVDVTETTAGVTILQDDPCEDSARGTLNVSNTAVKNAGVGDPRWYMDYVPAPTPELEPAEYGIWDLTDVMTFYATIDQSTVRGNLQFLIGSDPINVSDKGMEFTGAAGLEYGGVPNSSAIVFKVNQPGSIFASTLASALGSVNDHITVAVGPVDGSSATVVGAIHAGATDTKVIFDDINSEQLIYLYSCGPIILSALEWSADVTSGKTVLDTPVVTATPGDGTLSVSWGAIENAGSYIVSVRSSTGNYSETDPYSVTVTNATSYKWEDFPSGTYTLGVQAVAEDAMRFENSEIGSSAAATVTIPSPLPQLTSATFTREDMEFIRNVVFAGKTVDFESDIYYKGFVFTANSGAAARFHSGSKFGGVFFNTKNASTTGTDAARTIRFSPAGAGTLSYVVVANGDATDRTHSISIDGASATDAIAAKTQPASAPVSWEDYTCTRELTTTAGQTVDICSSYGSINFIEISWKPSGAVDVNDPSGLQPITVETTWGSDVFYSLYEQRTETTVALGSNFNISADYVKDNLLFDDNNTHRVNVSAGAYYYQFPGSSISSSGAAPNTYSRRYIRFLANGNGTLTINCRAAGSGTRSLFVAIGGTSNVAGGGTVIDKEGNETQDGTGAGQATPESSGSAGDLTWTVKADYGELVTIFANDGIRIFSIKWTPAE